MELHGRSVVVNQVSLHAGTVLFVCISQGLSMILALRTLGVAIVISFFIGVSLKHIF